MGRLHGRSLQLAKTLLGKTIPFLPMSLMAEDNQEAIKTILQHSQTPKSVPQIKKDLPDRLRVSSKELAALLDEMAAAGNKNVLHFHTHMV
jgi:hypothetical protein